MQSRIKTKSFPIRRFIAASTLLFVGAALWVATSLAQAQTVAGYPSQAAGSAITGVVSKGAGEAAVTITGVALKTGLSYCLVGVGRGHWHAVKRDGVEQFDLAKVSCAAPSNGSVVVLIKLDAKHYQAGSTVIGYVPVAVDASGKLANWQPYPAGSQKFERSDGKQADIVAIHWTVHGYATIATAGQALSIND